MKKIIIIFTTIFTLFFISPNLFGQHTLTVKINGLKNNKGVVLLEFSNTKGEKISGHSQTIDNKQCVIIITNIKQGTYSFKYFHDENKNQKLDTNFIGIPKEGFGFANDAKGKFGPPALKKTFILVNGDISQTCTAIYL